MLGKREEELLEEEQVKQQLIAKSEISIHLDTYDDIFSDFDPRPYSERGLSDDFLLEAKHAALDNEKGNSLELRFLIPKNQRSPIHETIIKRRLWKHFHEHSLIMEKEMKTTKRNGIFMIFLGVIFLLSAAYIAATLEDIMFFRMLLVLLEPAGWFTVWTGADQFYYTVKEKMPDFIFYQKMSKAAIDFSVY